VLAGIHVAASNISDKEVQVLERVTPGRREKEKVRAKENPRESPPHRGHQSRRRQRLRFSWPEMFLGCIVF